MGFESYFLIVWDFVKYAKDNGIAVGPGRGSAAGSIVSYVLRITDVDPLASDLMFERFLNAERKTMPDIDIDFSIRGRERVIRYVQEKYGDDAVAQIITFGKMKPARRDARRGARARRRLRDRRPPREADPGADHGPQPELRRLPGRRAASCARPTTPSRRRSRSSTSRAGLEDIVRNNSIHAAAVVIADRPLTEIVPLQLAEDRGAVEAIRRDENGGKPERVYKTVTQYSMGPIEEIGLLKMDFLGLRTLDVLENAVEIIERSGGERSTSTTPAARRPQDLRDARARRLGGRVPARVRGHAGGAAARSGRRSSTTSSRSSRCTGRAPMRFIKDYARGKRDPASVRYIDERLRPITEPTYGIAVYQEQLMQIARDIAGFPRPRRTRCAARSARRSATLMATLKARFVEGCAAGGTAPAVANQLWGLMEAAADYSFNKSHAACYGLIAYRTAYLKANYPAEYMAALISSVMSTKDKVPFFVSRCEEMGIEVLPPDVNTSGHDFVVVGATSGSGSTRSRTSATRRSRRSSKRARPTGRSPRSGTSARASTRARSTRRRSRA